MKFTKTHEVPHNSAEILLNTCQFNIFETYLGMCFAINLQIYLETLALKRENVPVPSVLRLLLRKTGHWPVHDNYENLCHWHVHISEPIVVRGANDDL